MDRALQNQKSLVLTVDDLDIPYEEGYVRPKPIHLSPCERIDIRFKRSPLEFFFPYAEQQALLSPTEQQYLRSLEDFVVDDWWGMIAIAYDASEARAGAFFTDRSEADLTCLRRDGSVVSLSVYDDAYLVTPEGQVFRCLGGLRKLRTLTPRIEALDTRIGCAANLKDLWRSVRSYYQAGYARRGRRDRVQPRGWIYPPANEWCDAVHVRGCACPGAEEGSCHYAMNPNCRPDSPGDMVLLFETKAGWNQHGGHALFTFENHNPRGGCVLLNDGTVKFIRTEDELRQLRWE